MTIQETHIDGLYTLEPRLYADERGHFMETFSSAKFNDVIGNVEFVQDNESYSKKGVLRGLHFQIPPYEQGKLVRVSRGAVLDVVVDLRKKSKTFGEYFALELSETNRIQLFIPGGFAHGFLVLEDHTLFTYKCSGIYSQTHERSLRWNDPDLNIQWGVQKPILSVKDAEAMKFIEFESPF